MVDDRLTRRAAHNLWANRTFNRPVPIFTVKPPDSEIAERAGRS
jgi:hypothetical protein